MKLPYWITAAILAYEAPQTGKVTITLEIYQNGITKMELGGVVRIKPDGQLKMWPER